MWSKVAAGVALAASAALAAQIFSQAEQIETLTARLEAQTAMLDRLGKAPNTRPRVGHRVGNLEARVEGIEQTLLDMQTGAAGAGVRPTPRAQGGATVAVAHGAHAAEIDSKDEGAVQHAVLEALESYDPAIRDRFRALIQEEQEELRKGRRETRRRRWTTRTRDRLDKVAASAGWSSSQTDAVFARISTEHDQIRSMFRKARQDGSFGEAHKKGREMRKATDAEVSEILDDDDKVAAYKQMREEDRPHHGTRRRRTEKKATTER